MLQHFKYVILNNSVEGILWVKLSASKGDFSLSICVCYLPPESSSRHINPYEFYDKLITQVHEYQQISNMFYISGALNGRCGGVPDFIEDVDPVQERDIVDTVLNGSGNLLIDFLLSSNYCILNGRNSTHNELTFRDISVIDYCLVAHEHLSHFQNFEVQKYIDLFEEAGCVGLVAHPAHIMPDHNLLMWSINLSPYL